MDAAAYAWMMHHGGVPTASAYGPYLNADGLCHLADLDPAGLTGIAGWTRVAPRVRHVEDALAYSGPVAVAIDATPLSFYYYKAGVYSTPPSECKTRPEEADHIVALVGYGEDYWILRNSWSAFWGMGGYMHIAKEGNVCGVINNASYPRVTPFDV